MVNTKGVEPAQGAGLPLAALNHISVLCRCLESSLRFYRDVLGFVPIRRPGSFDFDGAWYVMQFNSHEQGLACNQRLECISQCILPSEF
jgi:catechol 2,3-dioxygenase-like lactoylglutathione lyase family enzyme